MKALKLAALVIASFIGLSQGTSNEKDPDPIYIDAIGHKGLYYSAGAYCDYRDIANWSCGTPCIKNSDLTGVVLIKNPVRDTFVYVGYNLAKNEVVVAFRGTNGADLSNWITNIKAVSSPYPGVAGAAVHTGFQQAYNDVKAQLNQAVKNLMKLHTTAKIFVTGHSLGGALAVFAAVDIKHNLF
jgi:hypothetical protein